MTSKLAKEVFDDANYLWFNEGYTSRAVEKYKEAFRLSSDGLIIAFQLASALCALGRKDDALHYLAILDQGRQRLGEEGREQLDAIKRQCERAQPSTTDADDIEQLERQKLSGNDWFRAAVSAESKGLYGVALRAYELCDRGFVDLDLVHDMEDVRLKIERQLSLLEDMQEDLPP